MKLTLAILLLAGTVAAIRAQEARVVVVSAPDAAHAKQVYERFQQAQADWDAVKADIRVKYLWVAEGDKDATNLMEWGAFNGQKGTAKYARKGFEGEFEFSPDFRVIVPKSESKVYSSPWTCGGVFTPAQNTH